MREKKPSYQELEQSLIDTSEMLHQRIEEVKILKSKLNYLNGIYLHRNKCRFQVQFGDNLPEKARLHLLTTSFDANKLNIIIYLPHEQMEIVTVYEHVSDDKLAIDDISLNFVQCDMIVGKFLLEELIAQAKVLGLSIIVGQFSRQSSINFDDLVKFYQQAGFEVTENSEEGTGALIYRLDSNLF